MNRIRKSPFYQITLLLLFGFVMLFIVPRVSQRFLEPEILYYDDFVEYWAAGRLNLAGGNPYQPDQMSALQAETGRLEGIPLMMWNPPWTLALAMLFAMPDYPIARFLWLLMNLAIITLVSDRTWLLYGGSLNRRWLALAFALTFGPTLHVLKLGQITPFLLLGLAGLLHFSERGRWFWVGCSAALWLIKPHLLYLVLVLLFVWSCKDRRFSVFAGLLLTLLCASGLACLANPKVFGQYVNAAMRYPPMEWITPTLGGLLRHSVGPQHGWLQFLPPLVGVVWAVFDWRRHRGTWRWRERLPLVVLVSESTAAYGWSFDHVVSLIALVPALVVLIESKGQSRAWFCLVIYLVINGVVLFGDYDQIWYWWLAPSLLVIYQNAVSADCSAGCSATPTDEVGRTPWVQL